MKNSVKMSLFCGKRFFKGGRNTARWKSRVLAAAIVGTLTLAAGVFAQEATIPVIVTSNTPTAATVSITPNGADGIGATNVNVNHNTETDINIKLSGTSSALHGQRRGGAAAISFNRSGAALRLPPTAYANATVSLYSVNGRRVMSGRASASKGSQDISRANVAPGVYLLSVKGVNGQSFTSKFSHRGGRLNINVAFADPSSRLSKSAAEGDPWTITATAVSGYTGANGTASRVFTPVEGRNPRITINFSNSQGASITIATPPPPPCTPGVDCPEGGPHTPCKTGEQCTIFDPPTNRATFTETGVSGQSFRMLYVPGGSFGIGSSDCSGNNVTLSPYFISETTVSSSLWTAVMGSGKPMMDMDWYDAFAFACKLSQMTGKNYRMQTEAEYEYAAKGCASGVTLNLGSSTGWSSPEEWAYNSWESEPATGTDPIGGWSGWCTQKTRRNAPGVTDRLIRSIEGIGPLLRLVISADTDYPPEYVPSCNLKHPVSQNASTPNSWRDPRWVTGSNMQWRTGAIGIGSVTLHVWDDGTAVSISRDWQSREVVTSGQWFTSNNMSFVFVPSGSGTRTVYKYIFQDPRQVAIISDDGGFVGRIVKMPVSSATKPTVSGLMDGEALAKAQSDYADFFVMYDFANLPSAAKKKDARLIEQSGYGWFQNNATAGGIHNYRKDVTESTFRFAVIQGSTVTTLAVGEWFTVNNTFLRVTSQSGYVADYLYALTSGSDPTFYHNSYMGYEPGDFRMFRTNSNSGNLCPPQSGFETPRNCYPAACYQNAQYNPQTREWTVSGTNYCAPELSDNSVASMYTTGNLATRGKSTFVPPPMP